VSVLGPVTVLLISVATIGLDQVTKAAAQRWWGPRVLHSRRRAVPGLTGAVVLWAVMFAGSLVVASSSKPDWLAIVALSLAVGGGGGNVLDRSRTGSVVDFVAVGWWPVFNLADVALVSGAALAVVNLVGGQS